MIAFRDWLFLEERSLVDPRVLNSYERAFQQRLEDLIQRTKDPALRRAFEEMRECPIKNMGGRCSRFVDYIMAALVKQGCHHQYDVEGSLQRIIFKMLGKVGERGLPHKSLFDFDESRPFNLRLGNPLQVMFKKYLSNEIRSISLGCIPSLRRIQHPGRLTIGYGDDAVSPDEIPGRQEGRDQELMDDLIRLLKKQSTSDLNLVDLFRSMLNKDRIEVQNRRFGQGQAAMGRHMIVQSIERYARATQNWHMLRLLDRFRERFPSRFISPQRAKEKAGVAAIA